MVEDVKFRGRSVMVIVLSCWSMTTFADDYQLQHRYFYSGVEHAGCLLNVSSRSDKRSVLFAALPSAEQPWTVTAKQGRMRISCPGDTRGEYKFLSVRLRNQDEVRPELGGRQPEVFLTTKSDDSGWWDIEDEKWDGPALKCFLKASVGEFKGWYLRPGKAVENVKRSNSPVIGFKAREVTLSPDKKPEWRLYIYSDGK